MKKQIQKIKAKLKTPEYTKILTLRTIGNFLVLSSLFLIGKTFYLPVREEIRYLVDKTIQKKYIVADNIDQLPHDRDLDGKRPKGLLAKALNLKEVEFLIP